MLRPRLLLTAAALLLLLPSSRPLAQNQTPKPKEESPPAPVVLAIAGTV